MNHNYYDKESFIELIRQASTKLPEDVVKKLKKGYAKEKKGTGAYTALKTILENIKIANQESLPLCQDTGTLNFFIHYPSGLSTAKLESVIKEAVVIATRKNYLRPNSVDSLTGENPGNNMGIMSPTLYFNEHKANELHASLLLKGGGCENVSSQYSLPNNKLKADRDLFGVRKCVLDCAFNAQGRGCAPGIFGVGIGGDRANSFTMAKLQLFRPLEDRNPISQLNDLEEQLHKEINELQIGPMGFGGKTTSLGVKIGTAHRLPASFFVSVSYLCWAARRKIMIINELGSQIKETTQIPYYY